MIQLIGIKSECSLDTRQRFSIIPSYMYESIKKLSNIFKEVVIISTCNRTEIYADYDESIKYIMPEIFRALKWGEDLLKFTFHIEGTEAIEHLMEVACGFHSKILGEDQILGQIKNAYEIAEKNKTIKGKLQKLFQMAITCGKKFKTFSEIYKIPVSSSSIAVKNALAMGAKKFMILGFGEIGKLTLNYLENSNTCKIYVVVRDLKVANEASIVSDKVEFISFEDKKKYYREVDCIISCTSAPHIIINKEDLPNKTFLIFDMAVPRDVAIDVSSLKDVQVFDIDSISSIDEENKLKRKEKMESCRYIIDEYIDEYTKWLSLRDLTPEIKKLKAFGDKVASERIKSFKNKRHTKDNEVFAEVLLRSSSNVYVNRAIKVLKEEKLEGREEECLRIIQKIFYPQM